MTWDTDEFTEYRYIAYTKYANSNNLFECRECGNGYEYSKMCGIRFVVCRECLEQINDCYGCPVIEKCPLGTKQIKSFEYTDKMIESWGKQDYIGGNDLDLKFTKQLKALDKRIQEMYSVPMVVFPKKRTENANRL